MRQNEKDVRTSWIYPRFRHRFFLVCSDFVCFLLVEENSLLMSTYNQSSPNKFGSIPLMNSAIQMTNSSFIKSEIERFESVHPSIYSIYELLDEIKDQSHTQTQIRDHVMVIEGIRSPRPFLSIEWKRNNFFLLRPTDSFVNSQEWTISRSVLDIRIGLLGTLPSGKSALVHRFLTGAYMQEESPEGGRFKKEINIDNQSYLLLVRDEANAPDAQVCPLIGLVCSFDDF